jgi:hypothetical protein
MMRIQLARMNDSKAKPVMEGLYVQGPISHISHSVLLPLSFASPAVSNFAHMCNSFPSHAD